MSAAAAVRFTPTEEELQAMTRTVPGLTLPSFAVGSPARADEATAVSAGPHDPRLLLALGLQSLADGIVQTVSWSPGEVVRSSIAVTGVVAASVSRRDTASVSTREAGSSLEVALFPTARIAAELEAVVPAVDHGDAWCTGSRDVGVIASRAIVEAARHGDPLLVEEVAADLWVDADAAGMLQGLRARQSRGVRVRCFDGRSGRCMAGDDWFGSEHGWRRLRLGLPPSDSLGTTPQRLLDEATLSIAEATDEEIRRALTWLTATLLQAIAR
ncbi:hypothetical protein ACPPVW_12855 [Leifsonia sp. McL0607]|uniref:hypothetical protein n=1 Tax=Leifsonia sp. McL0607 TaxID=3415672 RepID=UPI003CF15A89